jgi:hypothetical protein
MHAHQYLVSRADTGLLAKQAKGGAFRFLNSGTYIGRVGDVRAMLESVMRDMAAHLSYAGANPLEVR